jgi:hypothetical protein
MNNPNNIFLKTFLRNTLKCNVIDAYDYNIGILQTLDRDRIYPDDPIGYCVSWVIWYLDVRLNYINNHPDDIMHTTDIMHTIINYLKDTRRYFKDHIRSYTLFLIYVTEYISNNKSINLQTDDIMKQIEHILKTKELLRTEYRMY